MTLRIERAGDHAVFRISVDRKAYGLAGSPLKAGTTDQDGRTETDATLCIDVHVVLWNSTGRAETSEQQTRIAEVTPTDHLGPELGPWRLERVV